MSGTILRFPKSEKKIIVETAMMRRVAARTLAIHGGSGMAVWHGPSRVGKTTTAMWMRQNLNAQYHPDNPDAFRVIHYEVGSGSGWPVNNHKRGIRSLYHACIGRLDEGTYRHLPPEDLARQLVHGIRRKGIQMIMVDEAGTLALGALRGMVLVRDTAELMEWPLTIVFIGMDDLPIKMTEVPQIEKRCHEWCYFGPYDIDETWTLLAALLPCFAGLDRKAKGHEELVQFVHGIYGGIPGEIVPFVRKLSQRLKEHDGELDLHLLQATHLSTQRDKERAIHDARTKYKGKPLVFDTEQQPKKPGKRAQKGGDAA
jgi:hypothetical protein